MRLYCKFHCCQDVRILKEGHIKFRNNNLKSLNIDVDNFISISTLANHYFKLHVYTQISNLMQYSGKVREFIQGAVYGGRNMCRDNTKQHVTKDLYDYDACSLYPSVIHRLKLATGKPIVIPQESCNKTILNHLMLEQQLEPTNERYISAFIVDIEITKVNKHLHFPIITKKDKKGNHNVNECCTMRVDNNMLEDMIKFQQIEFNIIRGYYWTGNPLQNNYKLLMNSSYGKTIQKPIKNDLVYKYINNKVKCDSDRYLKKNFTLVKSMYNISDNNRCFETNKPFDDFYVPNLIGVQILNTDSVHIGKNKIELLEQKYKEIYGKTLRRGELEQFHPDFDELSGDVYSKESFFLGKKAYIDVLTNDKQEHALHMKMKGIPNNLLENNENPIELYKKLYAGESYTYNLLELKPSFEFSKTFDIKTRENFTRKIQF
ncbi:hypothetical protein EIN_145810 [Entamoeba invadens IP1]|uniref:DNA-directed DNA polymerase n=1 Tax=Entamoeba invadens IP1 TaxID=370355 RepID=L7FL03_ENTIV|nr:hypothetical protein EIN_145810 [Entamoeba invadens IP1]ELP87597.1 hypothetical protein EIN_145810 [Entamoeba invadens IP1]|eukprot:XP_004254368.1 hypothetical protein EIN_145810 [Entamoeba invadens IP1]